MTQIIGATRVYSDIQLTATKKVIYNYSTTADTYQLESATGIFDTYVSAANALRITVSGTAITSPAGYTLNGFTLNTATLNSPTLVTPTIASFTNATHNHQNAAGGGTVSLTAAVTGILPLANGGTAISTTPSAGKALMGIAAGTYQLTPLPGVKNLGLTLASNVLTLTSADQTALSSSNVAEVEMSSTTAGKIIQLEFTAPVTIQDSGHATPQLKGNFGTRDSVAYASAMPFFIGVINRDDTSANAKFILTRSPCMTVSPSDSAKIGITTTAPSTSDQFNVIILDSGAAVANYTSKPVKIIGSVRVTKTSTAGGTWLFTALAQSDGIGQWNEQTSFDVPQGHFGSTQATSHFSTANGPTNSGTYSYYLNKNGRIISKCGLSITANGTDGVQARLVLPAVNQDSTSSNFANYMKVNGNQQLGQCAPLPAVSEAAIAYNTSFTAIANRANNGFTAADDVYCNANFQAF